MPSAMIKHHSQKQPGEDGVYFVLHFHITEGSQSRHSKQEMKQKPWRNAAYWPDPMAYSASFHIQPRTICPAVAPLPGSWILPTTATIRKIPYRPYMPTDGGTSLVKIASSFICLDLCRVDKNQPAQ